MRIGIGSDEATHPTEAVLDDLRPRGHNVTPVGPLAGERASWVGVARAVAEAVACGAADESLPF
jgi:ribose 5-phosphate isomerase RpiB